MCSSDLGRPYKDMPKAYVYRRTLVASCACKPAPWSLEAAAVHRRYAEEASELMADAAAKARRRYEAHLETTGAFPAQTPRQADESADLTLKTSLARSEPAPRDGDISADEAEPSNIVIGPPVGQRMMPPHRSRRSVHRRAAPMRPAKPQMTGFWGALFGKPD